MDPIDVREQRVTTGAPPPPIEGGTPVNTGGAYSPVAAAPATTVQTSRVSASPAGNRLAQLVWLIVGVVDAILALHFIFRALGANNTGFAHYIFRLGGWLHAPFVGIFNTTTAHNGLSVVRWDDILAVAVYTIAAGIVVTLVKIMATPRDGVSRA